MMLYIIRHAWAVDRDTAAMSDAERPLTEEGRRRFARVAKRLVERGCKPTLIATSPLVRCRETAEILAERLPPSPRIVVLNELAPGAALRPLVEWTAAQSDHDEVAWVGHSPDVEQLAAAMSGQGCTAIRFAKGATAAIRFDETLAAGAGELVWLASAKILGC